MSLLVRNLQKPVQINLIELKSQVKTLRRILKVERYDMSVVCIENVKIRELNRMYRGKDEPTEMLAFAASERIEPGKLPDPWSDIADLGDIFLGVPCISEKYLDKGKDIQQLLPIFITHGMCHLIGYNHKTSDQKRQMQEKEQEILTEFNKITGSDLQPFQRR